MWLRQILAACAVLILATPGFAQSTDTCPGFNWGALLDPGDQTFSKSLAERYDDGRIVVEIEFDELKGEYAKAFMFIEFRENCILRVFSVGSYALTASLSDGPRPYHLDLYESDQHSTFDFFDHRPDLGEIRLRALELFATPTQ